MDRGKLTNSMIITILLPIMFLLVMCFHYIPKVLHEVIGVAWLALVGIHLYQKRQWFKGLGKGNWNLLRVIGTVINILLIAVVLVAVLAGMGISNHLLKDIMPLDIQRSITIHQYHVSLPYLILIVSGIHWGLHWKGWITQWKNALKVEISPLIGRILGALLGVAVLAVGVYGSFLNRVGDRLLMKHIFATEATNETGLVYAILLCGIMGIYVLIGKAVAAFLKRK